jgi:hypothetical protein
MVADGEPARAETVDAPILFGIGLELGGRLTYLVDEGAAVRTSFAIRALVVHPHRDRAARLPVP